MRLVSRLLAPAVALALAACGGGDDGPEPIAIRGADYAFLMPDELPGGLVAMRFENVGKEVHEFLLLRMRGRRSLADVRRVFAAAEAGRREPSDWLEQVGGVPLLNAAREVRLTQELAPGRYALVCTFPSQRGVPHWRLGMIRTFRVAGDGGFERPDVDATITARDDAMDVPRLDAGRHVVRLVNAASEPRGFDLVTFEEENRDEISEWAARNFRGPPPATFLGVMHAVPPGTTAYAEIELEEGEIYVFLDDESGIRHEWVPR